MSVSVVFGRLKRGKSPHGRRASERGGALVEATIVLPLLLALFAAIFDLYHTTNAHMVLTHIARETVVSASLSQSGGQPMAEFLRIRADYLATSHGFLPSSKSSAEKGAVKVVTSVAAAATVGSAVQVEVRGTYNAFFPLLPQLSLLATAEGVVVE